MYSVPFQDRLIGGVRLDARWAYFAGNIHAQVNQPVWRVDLILRDGKHEDAYTYFRYKSLSDSIGHRVWLLSRHVAEFIRSSRGYQHYSRNMWQYDSGPTLLARACEITDKSDISPVLMLDLTKSSDEGRLTLSYEVISSGEVSNG